MYDTVAATIDFNLSPASEMKFPQMSRVDNVLRMWRNPVDLYEPRVTYTRGLDWLDGRLRIEFSIPKLLAISSVSNPTQAQTYLALLRSDQFLAEWLDEHLPPVSSWLCQRADYAWNFQPSGGVADYLCMLQSLSLGGMSRHTFPDDEGVVWKSKQPNHRWVKFYNKAKEAASDGTPTLRFEVSNYRRSLAYMCEKWFDCARTVGEVLHPGRALYCMARMWSKLGLFASSYHADETLPLRLKTLFGNAAPNAFYALMCISTYGAAAHKVHHLMSDNSYYTWQRRLREHDLLVNAHVYLPPLSLPAYEALKELELMSAQDLGKSSSPHRERVTKISPKNWQNWAKVLQVSKKSPEIGRLTALLNLSWEQINAENDESRRLSEANRRPAIKNAS